MSPRRKPITAGELMAKLEQDPEYVERQRKQMEERKEYRRLYAEAAKGLIHDLADAGFTIESLGQLRQRGVGNRSAVPVLSKWLPLVTYRPLKDDIIATLGSAWARPEAARPLIDEFRRIDPVADTYPSVRWSIGDALERVADESVLDDLLEIATDGSLGYNRDLIVAALGNMRKSRELVIPVLLELLNDDQVAVYAVMALGKLKAHEARQAIEPFVDHPESWVRKEAKKALAKLRV